MAFLLSLLLALPGIVLSAEESGPILKGGIDPYGLYGSPRSTYLTFLEAMAQVSEGDATAWPKAIAALDLSQINPFVREEKGRELARLLYLVLKEKGPPAYRVPRFWKGKRYPLLRVDGGRIELVRKDRLWRFSAESLERLPNLLTALSEKTGRSLPFYLRFRNRLPPFWRQTLFGVEYWQWTGLGILIVGGLLLERIVRGFLQVACYLLYRRRWVKEERYRKQPLRPLALLGTALFWRSTITALGLPGDTLALLLVPVKTLTVVASVWSGLTGVDLLADGVSRYTERTESRLDDALLLLFRKSLKLLILVIGTLALAAVLNINLVGLFAGLGLGGLAFALAARETVQNLFGSVTILLDQTFHIGDWVVIDDVEGIVEEIGFRSTKIRTFYDSLVVLPNAKLLTAKVDNMGRRRYRRFKCLLALPYATQPEKIEAFCEGLRELVRRHPYTRKDYYQIYCYELSPYAIGVLVYIFFEVPNWGTELRERQRFILDTLRLAQKLKIQFALPTQTLYLRSDRLGPLQPVSPEELLGEEAAREVAPEWITRPPPSRF